MIALDQNTGDFQKSLQYAFAIAQALDVGDLLIGLHREAKSLGNAQRPTLQSRFRGHSIERIIDFDGRKVFCVEGQHLVVGEFLRIKAAFPLLIRSIRKCRRTVCP